MSDNKNLNRAQAVGNDEFYTRYEVIEFFMTRIDPSEFRDKIVYCNCDWPESNYVKYYKNNFKRLGLKKLIATGIFDFTRNFDWHGSYYEYDGVNETIGELNGRGEFDSSESLKLLSECDIVVTNPPFSLMHKYMKTVIKSGKKYITLMSNMHLMLPTVIKEIVEGRLKIIVARDDQTISFNDRKNWFIKNGEPVSVIANIVTNIENSVQPEREYPLEKYYDPELYPKYDGLDIINVDKMTDIPRDYTGWMGIPITALCNRAALSKKQFNIHGILWHKDHNFYNYGEPYINGKAIFARLVVSLKHPENQNKL